MPDIPSLSGATIKPQGIGTPYRSAQVPEDAFGDGLGRAGVFAGASLGNYANTLQEHANTARVNDALAIFGQDRMTLMDEALQKNGKDAIGSTPEAMAKLTEAAKIQSQNLANDRQRDAFIQRATGQLQEAHAALLRNEHQQGEILAETSAVARIATAGDAAAKYRTQPELVIGAVTDAALSAYSISKARGESDEATAKRVTDAKSSVWARVLAEHDAKGENAAFIKAFEAVEGELNAEDLVKFSAMYRETSDLAVMQATVGSIVDKHPNDETAALAEARSTLSGREEENAVAAIKVRFAEKDSQRKDYQRDVLDRAWQAFEERGLKGMPSDLRLQMRAISGETEERMRQIEEQKANRSPGPQHSDMDVLADWMYHDPKWKTDPQNDPRKLKGVLRDEDLRYLMRQKEDYLNLERGLTMGGSTPRGKALDTLGIVAVTSQAVMENAAFFEASDNEKESIKEANERKGKFSVYVREKVEAFQDKNKRDPDYDETREIIRLGLIDGVREVNWGFDKTVKRFQAQPGDVFPPEEAPSVPDEEREKILVMMKEKNLPVTEDAILYWYKRKQAAP